MNARPSPHALLEARRLLGQHIAAWSDADEGFTVRSGSAALAEAGLPRQSKSHVCNLVQGDTAPTGDEVAVLVRHLSPDAIATGAARLAGGTYVPPASGAAMSMERRGMTIVALTGDLAREILHATADGELDEVERERLRPIVEKQVAQLQALIAPPAGRGPSIDDREAAARQTRGRAA